jgi:hypothetical protein
MKDEKIRKGPCICSKLKKKSIVRYKKILIFKWSQNPLSMKKVTLKPFRLVDVESLLKSTMMLLFEIIPSVSESTTKNIKTK